MRVTVDGRFGVSRVCREKLRKIIIYREKGIGCNILILNGSNSFLAK